VFSYAILGRDLICCSITLLCPMSGRVAAMIQILFKPRSARSVRAVLTTLAAPRAAIGGIFDPRPQGRPANGYSGIEFGLRNQILIKRG
jgi:hypothetical protein